MPKNNCFPRFSHITHVRQNVVKGYNNPIAQGIPAQSLLKCHLGGLLKGSSTAIIAATRIHSGLHNGNSPKKNFRENRKRSTLYCISSLFLKLPNS